MIICRGIEQEMIEYIFSYIHDFANNDIVKEGSQYFIHPLHFLKDNTWTFCFIENENDYTIISKNYTEKYNIEHTGTLQECIWELCDFLIDLSSIRDYHDKETISIYKTQIKVLVEEAIMLSNIAFEPIDENIKDLLKCIIQEMISCTKFYQTFSSHSLEIECIQEGSTLKDYIYTIKFCNGREDNYNPILTIHESSSPEILKLSIKEILLGHVATEDISYGFWKLMDNILKETIRGLNDKLKELGFTSDLLPSKDTTYMIETHIKDILDLARLCVIRGVIRYLKIIKNQYEPSDKWDKLLIMQ